MAIRYQDKVFSLETANTQYQIKIANYGLLQHLYYGKKIGNQSMDYLYQGRDRGHDGQLWEADDNRTFSVNNILQEYSGFGIGDYRTEALQLVDSNGGYAVDLCYKEHKIKQGKYCLAGLPAVYAKEEEAETLEITLQDRVHDIQVILYYGVLAELDIITRAARIINKTSGKIVIEKAASMCLDFYNSKYDLLHFRGKHNLERQVVRTPLDYGKKSIGSNRGISGMQHNPAVILCEREAKEDYGNCYGMVFVYSGNFMVEAEVDQVGQTRVVIGIHSQQFTYHLESNEEFITPEVVLSFGKGFTEVSDRLHKALREHLCRGEYRIKERPVLINTWEAAYFDFDADKIYKIAKSARELGIEMLVLDDGWFGKRENDRSSLGDWYVNEKKIAGGLKCLVDKINVLGMKFGLWFEPEMISEDSDLYRQHKDWVLGIPNRNPVRSRYQLVLDLSREEVREYIYHSICQILDSANIEYIKWDMNRSLTEVWSQTLPKERQGEVYHRYILGLYEILERLITRYPKLLIEGCASGGGRFDAGMLYYTPQIWGSDNTDAIDRLSIHYGTSFIYPMSAVSAHVSASPNHQTGRSTSMKTRGTSAFSGGFGYELDLNTLTEEEKRIIKEQIITYKQQQKFIFEGKYRRLNNPHQGSRYVAWQYSSLDKKEILLQYVITKVEVNEEIVYIRLKELEPDACYKREGTTQVYKGAALMEAGIPIQEGLGEYDSVVCYFVKKE